MKGCLVLSTLVLGLLSPAAAVARRSADQARRPTCSARLPVLLADTQATIYGGRKAQRYEVFGCVPGHRSYELGRVDSTATRTPPATGGAEIRRLTIAGPMVAFEEALGSQVVVRDLRTGRFLIQVPSGGFGPVSVEQIVVKSDGAVAWIVGTTEGHGGNPVVYVVYAVDAAGKRLLAGGSNIALNSLALVGSTLYWTQGAAPQSASLS
jgi:hypothetical protein